MENKQPFKAAVYMRVGNAAQLTHKETPVVNNALEARINAALNAKK